MRYIDPKGAEALELNASAGAVLERALELVRKYGRDDMAAYPEEAHRAIFALDAAVISMTSVVNALMELEDMRGQPDDIVGSLLGSFVAAVGSGTSDPTTFAKAFNVQFLSSMAEHSMARRKPQGTA